MAIQKALGIGTGTFMPYTGFGKTTGSDRSEVVHNNDGSVVYKIDLEFHKINEYDHIKWCRRNLGERSRDWDFWLAGGIMYIEVWGDKAKFTYEMWKN